WSSDVCSSDLRRCLEATDWGHRLRGNLYSGGQHSACAGAARPLFARPCVVPGMSLPAALPLPCPPAALRLAPGHGQGRVLGMDQAADPPGDDTLMQAWAGGDASAFESLYARHRLPLFRFLQGHVRDRALAEELFQDVWQRVIAARDGW